jgi:beta-N-acetylhexosaminidase
VTTPKHLLLFLLLPALGLVGSLSRAAESADPLAGMTLESKVGQLFIIGFPNTRPDKKLRDFIHTNKPGGFILFRRNLGNIERVRDFTSKLISISFKSTGQIPFLAVDQEGGSVTRLQLYPSPPSAYAIGLSGNTELAKEIGEESGRLLRWAGFNMNLAPVLDLSDPKRPSFLGTRSFGIDPELTGKMGSAYAIGLQRAGLIPTAKHFPGLGGTLIDLHRTSASWKGDAGTFRAMDLRPFREYSSLGKASAVMVSQMSYPFLDATGLPAPFSSVILKDLLRKEIGFQGLVITDDLQMKGSSLIFAPQDAALESLKAGADLVMITWSFYEQSRAIQRVVQAIRKGEWSEDELNDRVRRVLMVKKSVLEGPAPQISRIAKGPDGNPGTSTLEKIDLRLLDQSLLTDSKSSPTRKPAAIQANRHVCVVSPQSRFIDSFSLGHPGNIKRILLDESASISSFSNKLGKDCGSIIFAITGTKSAKWLRRLPVSLHSKIFAVNMGIPSQLPEMKNLAGRIELGHPYLHAGFRVAQMLGGRSK